MKFLKFSISVIRARDVVVSIVFFVLGSMTSWWTSVYFYEKSLKDSRASADEADKVNQLILRGIESFGTIKYVRDNSGKVIDVKIELSAAASAESTAAGNLK